LTETSGKKTRSPADDDDGGSDGGSVDEGAVVLLRFGFGRVAKDEESLC